MDESNELTSIPTVLTVGPYRFSSMPAIGTNRYMCMSSERTKWQSFGLIQSVYKRAEGFRAKKLVAFINL